jgi:hypothetical protein
MGLGLLGMKYHLNDAVAIAQINEYHPAVIAVRLDPPRQYHRAVDILLTQ